MCKGERRARNRSALFFAVRNPANTEALIAQRLAARQEHPVLNNHVHVRKMAIVSEDEEDYEPPASKRHQVEKAGVASPAPVATAAAPSSSTPTPPVPAAPVAGPSPLAAATSTALPAAAPAPSPVLISSPVKPSSRGSKNGVPAAKMISPATISPTQKHTEFSRAQVCSSYLSFGFFFFFFFF